jgi:membrane associated rhomboid family serine protease
MQNRLTREIGGVLAFVAILWGVFLTDWILPVSLTDWGLVPRTLRGMIGIPLSPFLHANWGHLIGNTLPILVLLVLMTGSRANAWMSVAEIIVLSGGLLWIFGRSAIHIGASGLIYGLIAFLIVVGLREGRLIPLGVAILVGVLYGGTLISGVLPSAGENVSWDGHLFGAVAGSLVGYWTSAQQASEDPQSVVPS